MKCLTKSAAIHQRPTISLRIPLEIREPSPWPRLKWWKKQCPNITSEARGWGFLSVGKVTNAPLMDYLYSESGPRAGISLERFYLIIWKYSSFWLFLYINSLESWHVFVIPVLIENIGTVTFYCIVAISIESENVTHGKFIFCALFKNIQITKFTIIYFYSMYTSQNSKLLI